MTYVLSKTCWTTDGITNSRISRRPTLSLCLYSCPYSISLLPNKSRPYGKQKDTQNWNDHELLSKCNWTAAHYSNYPKIPAKIWLHPIISVDGLWLFALNFIHQSILKSPLQLRLCSLFSPLTSLFGPAITFHKLSSMIAVIAHANHLSIPLSPCNNVINIWQPSCA